MNKCKVCSKNKCSINGFYKGSPNTCKECVKKRVKENKNNYDFTEKGVVRVIYKTQKRNNKIRGHGKMPYSKDELKEWLYKSGFKIIFDEWVASGYISALKPSVDRIDDFNGYSFDNIIISTWRKNREHQRSDIINGVGTGGIRCKTLYKFDGVRNLIASYVSYSSAARDVGYSLEYQIKKRSKCRNGYYWSYSDCI
mgnify:CR=1 FL=1